MKQHHDFKFSHGDVQPKSQWTVCLFVILYDIMWWPIPALAVPVVIPVYVEPKNTIYFHFLHILFCDFVTFLFHERNLDLRTSLRKVV